MPDSVTEYWFYHLEASMLEGVLPELLEKTRARGWRALVKMPEARLSQTDEFLWTYKDDSFLPHGRDDEPLADNQPVVLSSTATNSQGFDCVFLIDGEEIETDKGTERCLVMIDGRNEARITAARKLWTKLKASGAVLSYWQQNARGGWEKKA